MGKWKTVNSRLVHKNPYFELFDDDVLLPDGSPGKYYTLQKGPGVAIVPFDGKKIYLVNQYRYTFKKRMWELPAGKCETGDYLAQAKKELKEETGFTAKKWTRLGEFACAPGHSNHMGKVYLAEGLKAGKPKREKGEKDMVMKGFSLSQVEKMIFSGQLIDSWSIVPVYFFKQYLSTKKV
ncbi:MAG: NUDIX hydrolase [bacterium]|nr:NUDIX hydrolase [bacterium]